MTNKATNRDFCKRCGVSVTETDYDAGQCTNCGLGLPQKSMSKVSTRLMSLLQKRMPKLVKARASKRNTSKFQMFDVGEIMARHAELIRLAINRGYSVKALTGLVRAAEDAYQLNHA